MASSSISNLLIVGALCAGSLSYGYAFSIISTTFGQPSFFAYMGLTLDAADAALYAHTNQMKDVVLGMFSLGGVCGALFLAWLCDARGRKASMRVAAVVHIVGGALQTGSVHIAMMIVARFVTGFAAAMFVALVPIYIAEVAPPASRGFLVGQHGACFLFGYSIAAWVGVGSYFSANPAFSWRFPLSLQVLWPLLALVFAQGLPESPRWLVRRGRADEARAILQRLHARADADADAADPAAHDAFADQEFGQITAQYAVDRALYGDVGLRDLFRQPHFRRRMLLGTLVMWSSQANGNVVIYSNIVGLVAGLGFDATRSLILGAGYVTLACAGNFANALYLDKLGRVRSICESWDALFPKTFADAPPVIGYAGCVVFVVIETVIVALYGASDNKAALAAGVAMLFGFITFYGGFVDTTIYVYASEIFPTHVRALGTGWSVAAFFISTLPFLESSAQGFAQAGWKYYLLFILLPVINMALIYRFCPETKGLSLEEINGLFGDPVAVQLTHRTDVEKAARQQRVLHGVPAGEGEVEAKTATVKTTEEA